MGTAGGILTTKDFPFDLDTTSIGLTVTNYIDSATKSSVMDEMLTYINEDGITQVIYPTLIVPSSNYLPILSHSTGLF
jgi:hypothetical protein